AVEVSSVSGAGNPFDTPLEVEKLLELYQSNVVKKYKGEKNIGLGGDIFTVEAFCRELNKIHEFVKSKLSSSLKPILTSFAKSDEVRDIIRIQKKIVFSIS
ncbi:MFS transporter permease, partial [Yersinia enterocolitica]|nr:MFS transporter permease [Yersinia enterocolitica]EKN4067269.1 MFS transporter permease [Yersinia enterocolitica]HDL8671993.1 MFS transporter permease [Yersinia enterocolitica]